MKAIAFIFSSLILGALAIVLFANGPLDTDAALVLQPPSAAHWLGTDSLGRDLLAKIVRGTAITLLVGLLATVVTGTVGIALGAVSGWRGGWADVLLQRMTEVVTALPSFVFVTLLVFLGSRLFPEAWADSVSSILIFGGAIGLSSWTQTSRVTRALVLREKELPYVEAARATGVPTARVLVRHLLPNLAPAIGVSLANQFTQFLLFEGFLSFVGLGLRSPLNSWGLLLRDGWRLLATYPHLTVGPAAFIVLLLYLIQWSLTRDLKNIQASSYFG